MTPDGLPIVGYPEGAENFLQAVGMCGQGFMIGPGLGKILAESIASGGNKTNPAGRHLMGLFSTSWHAPGISTKWNC